MYLDASDSCNDLVFQLGQSAIGTSFANRQWSIKVTQYACDFDNLAPKGCTQYFYGESSDTVRTYNYAGGQHLAEQDQSICIRQEEGNCRICWTVADDADFSISGSTGSTFANFNPDSCCGYGTAGTSVSTYDCFIIPGVYNPTAPSSALAPAPLLCGHDSGVGPPTICSTRTPFQIRFLSNRYEGATEIADGALQKGAQLTFIQSNTNCDVERNLTPPPPPPPPPPPRSRDNEEVDKKTAKKQKKAARKAARLAKRAERKAAKKTGKQAAKSDAAKKTDKQAAKTDEKAER